MQFGSLPALIAAAVALGANNGGVTVVQNEGSGDPFITGVTITGALTLMEANGAAGFVVAITALAILLEVGAIILRFCNVGLVNLKIKIFLAIVSSCVYVSIRARGRGGGCIHTSPSEVNYRVKIFEEQINEQRLMYRLLSPISKSLY